MCVNASFYFRFFGTWANILKNEVFSRLYIIHPHCISYCKRAQHQNKTEGAMKYPTIFLEYLSISINSYSHGQRDRWKEKIFLSLKYSLNWALLRSNYLAILNWKPCKVGALTYFPITVLSPFQFMKGAVTLWCHIPTGYYPYGALLAFN